MNLYITKTHSDEEGPDAIEGKRAIIVSSKEDLLLMCDFFEDVKKDLLKYDDIHLHFRDFFDSWDKDKYIDLEVNVRRVFNAYNSL